jgi:hypothetical protein
MMAKSNATASPGKEPQPLFSLRATIIIALILFVPFVVRTLSNLQPYPALMFPAGAVEIPVVADRALFGYFLVYAKTPRGLQRLDPGDLVRPLPPQSFFDLASHTLVEKEPPATQKVVLKRLRSLTVPRHTPSAEERREIARWWSERVRQLHPGATQLVIQSQSAQFDLAQHRLAESRTDKEIVIDLP